MVQDQVEGAAQNVVGKVQDAVGALTGDAVDASRRQSAPGLGTLQQSYGQTIDNVRPAVAASRFKAC